MFERILVAVDGSDSGMEALEMAIQLQKSFKSELLILSVYRAHNMWKASVSMVNPELTGSTDDALHIKSPVPRLARYSWCKSNFAY